MRILKKIKQKVFNESIGIIEWNDDIADTIIWCFPRNQAEIKNGAQLIVRDNQVAVLVIEKQFADVFQPGQYELTTSNMPILTTLKGWKYDFSSPFKVDIYFVNTKHFLNLRWSAKDPIIMRDPEFGAVQIYACGSYSFYVKSNPVKFIRNVIRIDNNFNKESIIEQLHSFVIEKFTNYLSKSKIAVLDLAANLKEFSNELTIAMKDDFSDYSMELTKVLIDNISLPENVEEALNKRPDKNAVKPNNNRADKNPQQSSLPIIPQQAMYHIAVDGVQQGPFSKIQLQEMTQKGEVTPSTLVWTAGMAEWEAANSISSLSQLFGAVPPPL